MEIIRGILRYVPPITNDQRAFEGFGGDIMNVLPCKRGGWGWAGKLWSRRTEFSCVYKGGLHLLLLLLSPTT